MLKKSDGRIDWSREAQAIANQVRAFQPWPGATTFLDGKPVKLLVAQAYPEKRVPSMQPGQIAQADPAHGLWVQTGKGQLQILRLQMAGGKALETPAFLRGHPLPLNTTLQ
jgi:methionyl-tRNA formyltransferase